MKELAREGTHKMILDCIDELKIDKEINIFDAGCGEGKLLKELKILGFYNLFGADIVEPQNTSFFKFYNLDLNKSINTEETYSLIISSQNFEHLENHKNFIREAYKKLHIGGYLFISVPNPATWYGRLYFLMTGKFLDFSRRSYFKIGHINPVFRYLLELHSTGLFDLVDIKYNYGLIPLTGIRFKARSELTATGILFVLRKF